MSKDAISVVLPCDVWRVVSQTLIARKSELMEETLAGEDTVPSDLPHVSTAIRAIINTCRGGLNGPVNVTCKTCRHWMRDYPIANQDCNQCACGVLSFSRGCNVFDAGKKMVYTPPDFGCVYHQEETSEEQ